MAYFFFSVASARASKVIRDLTEKERRRWGRRQGSERTDHQRDRGRHVTCLTSVAPSVFFTTPRVSTTPSWLRRAREANVVPYFKQD